MSSPSSVERWLDERDLERLEQTRAVQDMEGWSDQRVKGRRWTLKRVLAKKDLR